MDDQIGQAKELLHEFAIDPSCLSSWERVKYFSEKLGFHQGRLIGGVPKKNKWRRAVYSACSGCGDRDKLRITEKLSALNEAFLEAGRISDGNETWLDNAEREHKKRPFRAIVADSNPRAISGVLLAADIIDETPLWNIERGCLIQRKAEILTRSVALALAASNKILFVDPYFNPNRSRPDFRRTLEDLVFEATRANRQIGVEYHCDDHIGASTFHSDCRTELPAILPAGQEVRFIRWKQRPGGKRLHARYILTDRGGIDVDPGLTDLKEDGDEFKLSLLEPSVYEQKWRDFQIDENPTTYELVDQVIIVGLRKS